jgi:hypothetical protein
MRVDGVTYEINWKKFRRGTSLWFPCLDVKAARKTVIEVTRRLNVPIVTKKTIEEGISGLRVWRL